MTYYALAAGICILGASLSLMYKSRNLTLTSNSSFHKRIQWTLYGCLLATCFVIGLVLTIYSIVPGSNLDELALIIMLLPLLGCGASLVMLSLIEPQSTEVNTPRALLLLFGGMSIIMFTIILVMRLI